MTNTPLQDFIESLSGDSHLRVEHDFGDGFVRLKTSEAERRQAAQDIRNSENIVLELLRNSRDAHASNIFIAMSRDGSKRLLTVIDDGDGIPTAMHDHVFEPRVTSKLDTNHMDAWGMHGRGMALYSVKVNSEVARVASSETGLGSSIFIQTDTTKLSERKDQSTFPMFDMGENGTVNVRGPRNILRTACEFAIDSRDMCAVYVGSPTEIASSLYYSGLASMSVIDRAFCRDISQLPVTKRLAATADPAQFCEVASSIGLDVSQRSARRVLDGSIPEARPILERITFTTSTNSGSRQKRGSRKAYGTALKLTRDESRKLSEDAKSAFADIAQRYYLEEDVTPSVRAMRDRITITIPVERRQD